MSNTHISPATPGSRQAIRRTAYSSFASVIGLLICGMSLLAASFDSAAIPRDMLLAATIGPGCLGLA